MQSSKGDKEEASHEQKLDREKFVNRNPHGNFKEVEASRKPWDSERGWQFTQTRKPDWELGEGATDGGESLKKNHVEIDPYADGRPAVSNYKLLISSIIPRPIGFVSTRSKDGMSHGTRAAIALTACRLQHQSCTILIYPSGEPRSSCLLHRVFRWLRQGQGQPEKSCRDGRMHHQHHL